MKVKITRPLGDHQPGDIIDVPAAQARGLVLEHFGTWLDDTSATTTTATASPRTDDGEHPPATTRKPAKRATPKS